MGHILDAQVSRTNGIIHGSYQIMFLQFIFAEEILFCGQTSCTFYPCVPGTFYVPGTFDGTYIGCIGIKKQME